MSRWTNLILCACVAVVGCGPVPVPDGPPDEDTLHIFHNNRGFMCLEALAWLDGIQAEYPDLSVEKHRSDESAGYSLLQQWKAYFDESEGISSNFGYLPIILHRGRAFSGFNDAIAQDLEALIASAHAPES
jgi:hypothetical protein